MDVLALDSTEASIPEIYSVEEMTPAQAHQSLRQSPHHAVPRLKKIRTKHHAVAKLIAAGFRSADIARKTGYTTGTISTFRSNPAFKELIEHYTAEYQESVSELHDRMEILVIDLMDELQDRLDDDDKRADMSIGEMKDLMLSLLDRTGRGPIKRVEKHTRSENVNIGIIQLVRERAAGRRFDALGPGPSAPVQVQTGGGSGGGPVRVRRALGEGEAPDRSEGGGAEI
jgi:hypothetical protein